MTEERIIPTPDFSDLPTVTIFSNGAEISREYNLASITVDRAVNKVPFARIVLMDGDVARENFEISDSEDFVPGNEIEILAGYHHAESAIFKGVIINHGVKIRKNKPSMLSIECRDPAVKMTIGRKNGYYYEMTDGEIIEELVNDHGLAPDVEATDALHKEMVKYCATDWDFMITRAEANGKLVLVDDGKIEVKAPDASQTPVLSLLHGSTIMEFEADMDARAQFNAAKCGSWDFTAQEMIEEESESSEFTDHGNLDASTLAGVIGLSALTARHTGRVDDAELKSWADARFLKSRMAKIIGRVKCQGFADVKPGRMIELNGVGDRFNGNAFVCAVRHQIDSRNWVTDIQFGLSPRWFSKNHGINAPSAAGLLPGVQGLQIGVATQLENDPDGEDRVLVRMPVVDPAAEGVWARVASLDAGENRGAFFRPEIGDEVALGFLNGDPRDPVILGMFNSSAKSAPIAASDDNHEKGFVTRGRLKLLFNDDALSVTIETPNGNKITLSDDQGSIELADENGNTVSMTSDGVTMNSAKDVVIKAAGDVSIEGANVNLKASAQLKAEGGAGAELSAGGSTVVKGAMVQIN